MHSHDGVAQELSGQQTVFDELSHLHAGETLHAQIAQNGEVDVALRVDGVVV